MMIGIRPNNKGQYASKEIPWTFRVPDPNQQFSQHFLALETEEKDEISQKERLNIGQNKLQSNVTTNKFFRAKKTDRREHYEQQYPCARYVLTQDVHTHIQVVYLKDKNKTKSINKQRNKQRNEQRNEQIQENTESIHIHIPQVQNQLLSQNLRERKSEKARERERKLKRTDVQNHTKFQHFVFSRQV